jgi:hypothetical protein
VEEKTKHCSTPSTTPSHFEMAEEKKSSITIEKKLLNPVELVDQLSGLSNEQKGNWYSNKNSTKLSKN